MKIAFPCESCGHRFQVDESLAGKKCKCKQCGHVFLIPSPRPAVSTAKPNAPAFDPYFDDSPLPLRSPRNTPSAGDDEEFLPPRNPKPLGFKPAKKKKRSDATAIEAAPWWVVKIGGGLTLASALVCLFSVKTGLVLTGVFYFGTAIILLGMGGIGMTVVPFLESAVCGLMNMFVPVYPLYYLITRWDAMKRWFLTYLAGALLFFPGLFFAVGAPVFQVAQDAVQLGRLRAEIDALGPGDPRRAELEAEFGRLKAKIDALGHQPSAAPPPPFEAPAPEGAPFGDASSVTPATPDQPREGVHPPAFEPGFVPRSDGFDVPSSPAPSAPAPKPAPPRSPSNPTDPNFLALALSDLKLTDASRKQGALEGLKGAKVDQARRAEVSKAVEPLLADPAAGCRIGAANALATWGSKANTPALVKVLGDRNPEVRGAALDALAAIQDPAAAEAVAARLADTRDKAAQTLKAIGKPAEPAVIKYLTHDDIWVRTEACKVLEEIGGSDECKQALAGVVRKANGFGFDADAAKSALEKLGSP